MHRQQVLSAASHMALAVRNLDPHWVLSVRWPWQRLDAEPPRPGTCCFTHAADLAPGCQPRLETKPSHFWTDRNLGQGLGPQDLWYELDSATTAACAACHAPPWAAAGRGGPAAPVSAPSRRSASSVGPCVSGDAASRYSSSAASYAVQGLE